MHPAPDGPAESESLAEALRWTFCSSDGMVRSATQPKRWDAGGSDRVAPSLWCRTCSSDGMSSAMAGEYDLRRHLHHNPR